MPWGHLMKRSGFMQLVEALKDQILNLVRQTTEKRQSRTAARREEMTEGAARKALFGRTAHSCITDVVVPRLETLRESLGNCNPVQISTDGASACVGLRSSDVFPVGADLSLVVGHDSEIRTLEFTWKVSVIPILIEYDREASLSLSLDSPDKERLGRFVDERILRFVADYLRIHEPDSPYILGAQVRDPVCDMAFPASEAVSSITVGNRSYYFCAEECATKFEVDRSRYTAGAGK
jgi:YHS domain-containing protein